MSPRQNLHLKIWSQNLSLRNRNSRTNRQEFFWYLTSWVQSEVSGECSLTFGEHCISKCFETHYSLIFKFKSNYFINCRLHFLIFMMLQVSEFTFQDLNVISKTTIFTFISVYVIKKITSKMYFKVSRKVRAILKNEKKTNVSAFFKHLNVHFIYKNTVFGFLPSYNFGVSIYNISWTLSHVIKS